MMLRFCVEDFNLLKTLTDEEVAETFKFLYGASAFLKGCVYFRENCKDIIYDVTELAEVVAEEIATRANLNSVKCNTSAFLKECMNFSETCEGYDISKLVELAESIAKEIAEKAKTDEYNFSFHMRDFTFYTPLLRTWLNSQKIVSNWSLPYFSFSGDLGYYIRKASSY